MIQRLVQPGSRSLLTRILDQPDLPVQIQALPPAVLGRLIDQVGLEDAGELVALATTEQLFHMLDEDVWSSNASGEAERFDADRMLVWLEVMQEAGDTFLAGKLSELPEDLVTLALHKHVLVLNIEELALSMQAAEEVDARQLDKALESCLYEEIGEYQVMARNPDGWDTILSAMLALDGDHHEMLARVLERCCRMASEYIEDNGGLYQVLTSDEMLENDLAGDREERRAERGYVAPATAASFLKLARSGEGGSPAKHDPVTRSYFRGLAKTSAAAATRASSSPRTAASSGGGLDRILRDEGMLREAQAERLLEGGSAEARSQDPVLVQAMRQLAESASPAFEDRSEELAYLANVLVAGCSIEQRKMRPIEALRAALATCSLGLSLMMQGAKHRAQTAAQVLAATPADGLFRLAWQKLNDEVIDRAAGVCIAKMQKVASESKEDRAVFIKNAAELRKSRAAGAPWKALELVDTMLGALEAPEVDALGALMDACPHLAGALQDKGKDAPAFITSPADLEKVDRFLGC
jgi:hypothetical protein